MIILKGDVNNNGVIDIDDALLIEQYVLGTRSLTEQELIAADVNNDGLVNLLDSIIIKQHIMGINTINEFQESGD